MDLLSNLQNMLGQAATPVSGSASQNQVSAGKDGLGALLDPKILGGLASALFANKAGASGAPGARAGAGAGGLGALGGLLSSLMSGQTAGGGSGGVLGSILSGLGGNGQASAPQSYASRPAATQENQVTMLRALIYAARADGHIDANEEAMITDQIRKSNSGPQVQALVDQMMDEPLDPKRIADNVTDSREAITIYAMSCALTNMDQFMEKSYLDGLASALRIPADAKAKIEAQVQRR